MADPLQAINTGGIFGSVGVLINIFVYVVIFLVVGGIIFLVFWLLKDKIMRYKYNVLLRFEVGENVVLQRDRLAIIKNNDKYEAKFKKNRKVLVDVPSDQLSFYIKKPFGVVKCYEALVRNDNAAWVNPHPSTYAERDVIVKFPDGTKEKKKLKVNTFITMPSNLARFFMDQTRRNIELAHKKKWFENPILMTGMVMGVFIIGVVFLFIMNKNTAEIALEAVRMGGKIMETAAGQVVR
jgi:hypothetical protein